MNKEFVPYEQALALKELGIDQSCYASYGPVGARAYKELSYGHADYNMGNCIGAPTFSQAFRWFREKYKIDVSPLKIKIGYTFVIVQDTKEEDACRVTGNTYEEAELVCLKKLIEIVKSSKIT